MCLTPGRAVLWSGKLGNSFPANGTRGKFRLVYDDSRPGHHCPGTIVNDSYANAMLVQFDDRASPNLIDFNEPEWMDYITFGHEATAAARSVGTSKKNPAAPLKSDLH